MAPWTLPREFYDRPVECVARELLGCVLVRRSRYGLCSGVIVETEAYLARDDSASHSFRGRNRRNRTMFGPPGFAYVYTIHARQCVNVVTQPAGVATAVLIRALEPVRGIALMQRYRSTKVDRDLCRGPARLCEAFQIDRCFDGWDLTQTSRLWIERPGHAEACEVAVSTRIGVTSAADKELRFFVPRNRYVSGPKWLNTTHERLAT